MTIWKTLLSIRQNTTDFTQDYNIEDFQFKVVPTQGHPLLDVSFIFDKEETVFSGDALFKETIGRWTFQQGTTNNYSLVLKNNSLHFLTTTESSQVMDGTPLLVMRRSLTHIFHKKTKACRHLL